MNQPPTPLQSIALRLRLAAWSVAAYRPDAIRLTDLVDAAEAVEAADVELAELRAQVAALRSGIVGHRGRRDFMGGAAQCD